jgi:uncharacterized phosphosugar-binding protein
MTVQRYFDALRGVLGRIEQQQEAFKVAAGRMAESIAARRAVYFFGSGHSVLPTLDVFPRYGSFVGLQPLIDPRLMWFNILGPGGVRELLWLERTPGYAKIVARSYSIAPKDTFVIYSHGGLNAAPIEMAQEARARGAGVVAVTSIDNRGFVRTTQPDRKALADFADVVIDNGVPLEDSLVKIDGWGEPVAAGSTVAVTVITMALVAETAAQLAARGIHSETFVSPNVSGYGPEHNDSVFAAYANFRHALDHSS